MKTIVVRPTTPTMRFLRAISRPSRPQTRLRATPPPSNDNKPVFQNYPTGTPLSFEEMKDAHDIFSEFPIEQRDQCYAMYNIDGEAMRKYYRHALSFERMYQIVAEKERKQKSYYFKVGPFHIYISKD